MSQQGTRKIAPADDGDSKPGLWEVAVAARQLAVSAEIRGSVPGGILRAGARAAERFLEFFTATIRNKNTRAAYAHAVRLFFEWLDERGLNELVGVNPVVVGAYIEKLTSEYSKPTVKQHLAAIRMLFDYLVLGGILPVNPAAVVRGPKHNAKRGKTPVLSAEEARQLLDSIETDTLIGLRDRALIGLMVFSFARVSAAVSMRVEDFFSQGKTWFFRLHEKGGKRNDVIAHHKAESYLDAYLDAAGIRDEKSSPLFRSVRRCATAVSGRGLSRTDALRMVYRRTKAAGLATRVCNHTFRATGITNYLEQGGKLDVAQEMAGHESSRTTGLYDRREGKVTRTEVERISI